MAFGGLLDHLKQLGRLDHLAQLRDPSTGLQTRQDAERAWVVEHKLALIVAHQDGVRHAVDHGAQAALLGGQLQHASLALRLQAIALAHEVSALERLVHHADELVGGEWLGEEVVGPELGGLDCRLDGGVGGHDHAHRLRCELRRPGQELKPPDTRHFEVHQGQVDVRVLRKQLEALLRGLGQQHVVTFGTQDALAALADANLVVHHQDLVISQLMRTALGVRWLSVALDRLAHQAASRQAGCVRSSAGPQVLPTTFRGAPDRKPRMLSTVVSRILFSASRL